MPSTTAVNLRTLLAEFVQIPTLTAETATCQAMLDLVKYYVRDLPLYVTDFVHHGQPSLVLTTRPTKRPAVLLMAHLDVAPARPELFALQERDGRYYGRGVFDMKYAAASYLKLLLDLGDDLPNYDLGVMLTTDEETGGHNGVKALVEHGWRAGVVVNPDAIPDWQIERSVKGSARYAITSRGTSGHASRPWDYENALMKLMKCLDEIGQHFPVAEPCGDPTHAHHTYSVDVMHAGELVNQIPDAAEAHIDIRITPGTTLDEISQIVRDTVSKYASVTVAPLMESSPATVDTKDPKLQLLHQLISRATGTTPELTLSHGQSDSSYFRAIGVTVLMFGPPGGGHHSGHEWIDAQGVEQFHDILHEFIEAVAQTEKPAAK